MPAETAALLLAAGKGTRMRSPLPKALVPVSGRPILRRLADAVEQAGVSRVVLVLGHRADEIRAAMGPGFASVIQEPQLGTGHAVRCAREALAGADPVLVFVGDSPLIRPQTVRSLLELHARTGAACTFLTSIFPRSFPYARVLRDGRGRVAACVEERRCTPAEREVLELFTSHYCFRAADLWEQLDRLVPDPDTGETYLTDIIGALLAAGRPVEAWRVDDWAELVGLNTLEEVAWAEARLGAERA
jgi:bifunctional N-acetylglucosamine-1-phosphate-uridyltransferase/glucosamine-1-phosphate-acetyltransferase GlmU-like protein